MTPVASAAWCEAWAPASLPSGLAMRPPCGRGPLPDVEGYLVAGRSEPLGVDARDVGEPRAVSQPREEGVGGTVVALGEDLDVAVEPIAHPAREAKAARLGGRRRAEPDSLHAPPHGRFEALHGP